MIADSELQRIVKLTPLAEVLASFDIGVGAVAPREVTIEAALGRALAADVPAPTSRPGAAVALRDGFALRAELTADASSYAPAPLSPAPPRIEAGETLHAEADAVASYDSISTQGGRTQALAAATPGEGVLAPGADAAAGTVLKMAGARLRRIDAAVLTALGIERVAIREPRLRVVRATGGEIVAAAAALIANSIDAEGGIATQTPQPLEAALEDGGADAVVAIGGTGMGRNDTSVNTLARLGTVAFHGIGIAPGETTALGYVGARPVLLLPGRLDAALAGWLTVGRRMLARLAFRLIEEQPFNAELSRKVASPLGLAEVVPVRRRGFRIEPMASQYLPLQTLARADGWILVPADSEGYPVGASVPVRPWP